MKSQERGTGDESMEEGWEVEDADEAALWGVNAAAAVGGWIVNVWDGLNGAKEGGDLNQRAPLIQLLKQKKKK